MLINWQYVGNSEHTVVIDGVCYVLDSYPDPAESWSYQQIVQGKYKALWRVFVDCGTNNIHSVVSGATSKSQAMREFAALMAQPMVNQPEPE